MATYTIEEIGARIKQRRPDAFANYTDAQIGQRMVDRDPRLKALVSSSSVQTPAPAPKKSFFADAKEDIGSAFSGAKNEINKGITDIAKIKQSYQQGQDPFSSAFQATARTGAGIFRAGNELLLGGAKALLPQAAEDKIGAGFGKAVDFVVNDERNPFALKETIDLISKQTEQLKESNPTLYRNLKATLQAGEVGLELAGADAAIKGSRALKKGVQEGAENLSFKVKAGNNAIKDMASQVKKPFTSVAGETPSFNINKLAQGVQQIGTDVAERVPRAGFKLKGFVEDAAENWALGIKHLTGMM